MKKYLIIIALLLSASLLFAQKWERVNINFGGDIREISKNEKGTLLLQTGSHLYTSSDKGESWRIEKPYFAVTGFPDSVKSTIGDNDELFFINKNKFYKIQNEKEIEIDSFQIVSGLKYFYGKVFLGGKGVYSTLGEKLADMPIFTEILKSKDGDLLLFGDSLYVSQDSGITWVALRGLEKFNTVETDGAGKLFFAYQNKGILSTSDTAKTFDSTDFNKANVQAIRYIGNGELLAASNLGLFKSTDNGSSWGNSIHSDTAIYKIIYTEGIILALSANSRAVYRSTDGGTSWNYVVIGIAENAFWYGMKITENGDLYIPDNKNIIKLEKNTNKQDTICSSKYGVFMPEWENDDNFIFYHTVSKLYRLDLNDNHIDSIDFQFYGPISNKKLIKIDNKYYFNYGNIEVITHDFSERYIIDVEQPRSTSIMDKSKNNSNIYIFSDSFWVSKDTLKTFENYFTEFTGYTFNSMIINSREKIFISSRGGELARSLDTGKTWEVTELGFTNDIKKLYLTKDDVLLIATDNGLFALNTNAEDMNIVKIDSVELGSLRITNIAQDSEGYTYLAMPNIGIYKTKNIVSNIIAPILISPNNQDTVYNSKNNKLVWEETSGAVEYDYQVSETADFEENEVLFSNKITGANEIELAELEYGKNYYWRVRARNSFGIESEWSEIWSFYVDQDTYISEAEGNNLTISPNPAKETIEVKSNEIIEAISIYSLSGQIIKNISINALSGTINIKDLSSGAYILIISSNGKTINRKIIKE